MKGSLTKLFMLVFVVLTTMSSVVAQQRNVSDIQKRKEKVERSYNKAYAKARKKTIKHRREIQTDETKKRMNAVDKKAKTNRNHNKPGFLERQFKRKRPPKR